MSSIEADSRNLGAKGVGSGQGGAEEHQRASLKKSFLAARLPYFH